LHTSGRKKDSFIQIIFSLRFQTGKSQEALQFAIPFTSSTQYFFQQNIDLKKNRFLRKTILFKFHRLNYCHGESSKREKKMLAANIVRRSIPVWAAAAMRRKSCYNEKLKIQSRATRIYFLGTFLLVLVGGGTQIAQCEKGKDDDDIHIFRGTLLEGGREYKGQTSWWTGKPQGQGTMIFIETGDIYEGRFYDGSFYGQGKYIWSNGNRYEGNYKEGKMCGKGKLSYANGTSYEGDFFDDRPQGQGKFYELDGTFFEGEYKSGRRNGVGKYQSIDGTLYEGEWKNDVYHGRGKMIFPDGLIFDGGFINGKRHGKGMLIFPDGSKIEVEFHHGQRVF
jgi:hypothetical protein